MQEGEKNTKVLGFGEPHSLDCGAEARHPELLPKAQTFYKIAGAVAQPGVELGGIFELLTTGA